MNKQLVGLFTRLLDLSTNIEVKRKYFQIKIYFHIVIVIFNIFSLATAKYHSGP